MEELREYLTANWKELRGAILAGAYQPQPVRRVEIPKGTLPEDKGKIKYFLAILYPDLLHDIPADVNPAALVICFWIDCFTGVPEACQTVRDEHLESEALFYLTGP